MSDWPSQIGDPHYGVAGWIEDNPAGGRWQCTVTNLDGKEPPDEEAVKWGRQYVLPLLLGSTGTTIQVLPVGQTFQLGDGHYAVKGEHAPDDEPFHTWTTRGV